MKTEKILEIIKENQFKGYPSHWDILNDWIGEEDFEKIKEVGSKETNPRRDYLGTQYYLRNEEDGKFFFMEFYGDDMGHELYDFGEVRPVEKTVTVYESVE